MAKRKYEFWVILVALAVFWPLGLYMLITNDEVKK